MGANASLTFTSDSLVTGTTNTLQGTPNTVVLGKNATLTVDGWDTNIIASNDSITLGEDDDDTTISGTGDNITLGAGATIQAAAGTKLFTDTVTLEVDGGAPITFAPDTILSATEISNNGDGTYELGHDDPVPLAALSVDTSTGADSVAFADGLGITLGGVTSNTVAAVSAATSALQTMADYLTDLGDTITTSALDALNYAYLNPTGTGYTVTGTISGGNDTFLLNSGSGSAPGAEVTGVGGKFNILNVTGINISQDAVSGIQELNTENSNVTLTNAQFTGFGTITGGGSITAADGGTFSLASGNVDQTAAYTGLTATDWLGTTLIGNNENGQTLTASLLGNDKLYGGGGTGDTLTAGEGVDTLVGGTGGDAFVANGPGAGGDMYGPNGLAAGSSITGSGTGNSLTANGDLTGVSISGIQTLDTGVTTNGLGAPLANSVTLTNAQFNGFTTISGGGDPLDGGFTINAATGGTYNLATSANTTDEFSMTALSNAGTTLTGNDGDFETLTASATGNDTLTAGSGVGDTLIGGGGTDTLSAGGGDGSLTTSSNGNNTLTVSSGSYSLTASGNGNNALTAGDTDDDTLTASGDGNNTLIAGDGVGDTLTASGNGNNTLTAGDGEFDVLTASGSGNNTLTAGNGTGDTLIVGGGVNTLIGGTGGDTFQAVNGLASGSSVTGSGTVTGNGLFGGGDITGATLTDIGGLVLSANILTLTASQFGAFDGVISNTAWTAQIDGATSGTYNLGAVDSSTTQTVNMTALASGGTTLIGSNGAARS